MTGSQDLGDQVKTAITKKSDGTSVESPTEAGDYQITFTPKDEGGSIGGSKTIEFTVAEGLPMTKNTTTLYDGNTYLVEGNVTVSQRITVIGTVTLKLADGCTLTAQKGIEVSAEAKNSNGENKPAYLIIKKADDATGTGKVIATGEEYYAGIGAYHYGTIEIESGVVESTGGYYAAGIGGSRNDLCGTINIKGGTIIARGGFMSAGIGGAYTAWAGQYGLGGNINISGGNITAIKGDKAQAGIGAGFDAGGGQTTGSTGLATVTITYGENSSDDYIITSDGFNASTITIDENKFLVEAEGDYAATDGSNVGTHKIYAATEANMKDLATAKVTLAADAYPYTGTAQNPAVTAVTRADGTPVDASNYTVEYSENTAYADINTVTVTGKGDYSGVQSVKYGVYKTADTVTPSNGFLQTNADGNPYFVNMPAMPATGTASQTITIPSDVTEFNIYDDGGVSGYHAVNYNGSLTLIAPEGYVFEITGNVAADAGSNFGLMLYEGNTNTKIGNNSYGYSNGQKRDIGTLYSKGDTLSVKFLSSSPNGKIYTVYEGFSLHVKLISTTADFTVTANAGENGSVSPSAATAHVNDAITLTATPDDGYRVSDFTSGDIKVDGGWWSGNKGTFSMPAKGVTVTANFTDATTAEEGLFINLPKTCNYTGDNAITIPEGITSFKVYDDGGKDANHSQYSDAKVTFTAPEGTTIKLTGKVSASLYNALSVYDGNSITSASRLGYFGKYNGEDVGTLSSTGESLTITFAPSYYTTYAGLDLTVEVVSSVELTLNDDSENKSRIEAANKQIRTVTLQRTFDQTDTWYTLCLPFDLTLSDSPLGGADVRSLVMNFGDGEQTGISLTTTAPGRTDNVVYDLQGRRIGSQQSLSHLPTGIYIVNGKKMVVK